MLHRLVGDGKLCQVVANHLRLHAKTNKSGTEPKKQQLEKQVQVLPKNKEQTSHYQKYFMYHSNKTHTDRLRFSIT
jgi:hypothetical protein